MLTTEFILKWASQVNQNHDSPDKGEMRYLHNMLGPAPVIEKCRFLAKRLNLTESGFMQVYI